MRRPATALLVSLALVASAAASAEPAPARLVYELGPGTDSCPTESALHADVAARLGYDPFQGDARRQVVVRIAADGRGLRARVRLLDEGGRTRGERELSSSKRDCRELAASVGLAVSIAIDPLAAARPAASASSAPPPPPPAASSALPAPLPAASSAPPAPPSATPPVASAPPAVIAPPPTEERSQARGRAAAGLALSSGAAPATAVGLVVQAGVGWPSVSLSGEGRLDLPAGETGTKGRVQSALLLGALVPCAHLGPLLGCGVLAAGGLRGSGDGVDHPKASTTFYAAAGPRVALEIGLTGPLALRAWGDALATLTRTRLSLDGVEAWRTPPLSFSLGLGLALRFP